MAAAERAIAVRQESNRLGVLIALPGSHDKRIIHRQADDIVDAVFAQLRSQLHESRYVAR